MRAWIRSALACETKAEKYGFSPNLRHVAKANPAKKRRGNFPLPATAAHASCPGVVQDWKSLLSSPGCFITTIPMCWCIWLLGEMQHPLGELAETGFLFCSPGVTHTSHNTREQKSSASQLATAARQEQIPQSPPVAEHLQPASTCAPSAPLLSGNAFHCHVFLSTAPDLNEK